MERIYSDIPLSLPPERILTDLKMPNGALDEVAELIDKSLSVANPKVLVKAARVEIADADTVKISDMIIKSRLVAKNLSNAERAFAYVGTCGTELDGVLSAMRDPFEQFCQAQINQRIMQIAVTYARADIARQENAAALSAVNPGSNPDWPITAQRDLFAFLGDVKGLIGVELTESCLMLPIKSVSGIWFAAEHTYENCMVCRRENCVGRRAPFDEQMFMEMIGGGEEQADACSRV